MKLNPKLTNYINSNYALGIPKVSHDDRKAQVTQENTLFKDFQAQKVPLSTWHAYSDISFGYNHPLKSLFKTKELPTVKKGLYGDILTRENVSLEHIKPHSKGGKSSLSNYALASASKNNMRGNSPLTDFLSKDKAVSYLDQFRDVSVTSTKVFKDNGKPFKFDGNGYIKLMVKALLGEGIDVTAEFKDLVGDVNSIAKNI